MRLLIDIGNTRIKWAWSTQAGVLMDPGVSTEITALLSSVSKDVSPDEILVSDVRCNGMYEALTNAFASLGWKHCTRIETKAVQGALRIGYSEPSRLGVDRFIGLVEASALLPSAVIVVDAGTALTLDAMTADGQHQGGVIMPGLSALGVALESSAPRLPSLSSIEQANLSPWARDTQTAMGNGLMYAWAGAAGRIIDDMRDRLGNECKVLLGGGDGLLLKKWLKGETIYDESLILRGMTRL